MTTPWWHRFAWPVLLGYVAAVFAALPFARDLVIALRSNNLLGGAVTSVYAVSVAGVVYHGLLDLRAFPAGSRARWSRCSPDRGTCEVQAASLLPAKRSGPHRFRLTSPRCSCFTPGEAVLSLCGFTIIGALAIHGLSLVVGKGQVRPLALGPDADQFNALAA